jgi:SAM-dependent methyltransferase
MKNSMFYNEDFYQEQAGGSYRSALLYVPHLLKYFSPGSVVDVGCGRGTWLKAFKENGVTSLTGFDGEWNTQKNMIEPSIRFFSADLNHFSNSEKAKFDLAVSLGVAEHLKESSALQFIAGLASLAEVVLFSSAFVKQGGPGHINEQFHSYWAKLFREHGYHPYDLFRPTFWGHPEVEFWYQQNTFLYVKESSPLNQSLKENGLVPLTNLHLMDCVHPELYKRWVSEAMAAPLIKRVLYKIIPKQVISFLKKFFN